MGNYRIVVDAVGGHGCQRDRGDGEMVMGCGHSKCPDCIAVEFVEKLKAAHQDVKSAELIHWPGDVSEVRDEIKVQSHEIVEYTNSDGTNGRLVRTTPAHRIRHGKFKGN